METFGPFPSGSFKMTNGSPGVGGLPGTYRSADCQKAIIRAKSLTSITIDPMRTVPVSMMPMTGPSGDKLYSRRSPTTGIETRDGDCLRQLKALRVLDAAADLLGPSLHPAELPPDHALHLLDRPRAEVRQTLVLQVFQTIRMFQTKSSGVS